MFVLFISLEMLVFILSELFPVWDLCVCRTPATMESGQKRCVGRCWDFIFFALGAGSGLLASNIGWRIRRRALMNLHERERDRHTLISEK